MAETTTGTKAADEPKPKATTTALVAEPEDEEEAPAEQPLDPLDESPIEPAEGVDENPAADGSVMTGAEPPMSPAQRARVQGTVLDGANGAAVTGSPATEPVPGAEEKAEADAKAGAKAEDRK